MILDDPDSHFIFVYHPFVLMGRKYTVYEGKELTNAEVLEYWGKWLVLGERARLDELAKELDPHVEDKKIPCIKYDRVSSRNLGIEECVMMVYCDRRARDGIWEILKQFGVKIKAWVTEKQTMEMWLPGQPLMERWLASQDFDAATIEAIRQDARARIQYVHDHPDEVFTSWEQ